jgi:hypothetical protein
MSDLCHIEIIAGNADDQRMHGCLWLCPEPGNEQDGNAVAVHDVDGRIAYVSRRFTGLAREELLRGSKLRVLSSLSRHVWYGALG